MSVAIGRCAFAACLGVALAGCGSAWTGGIQAVMTRHGDGALRVVDVPPGSAADRAGLREGDEIVTIDRAAVAGRTTRDAVARLRGEVGTTVVLGVQRGDDRVEVRVERGPFGERFGRDRREEGRATPGRRHARPPRRGAGSARSTDGGP